MKIIDKIRNKHVEMFLLLTVIYVIGLVADGFGFFNWVVNALGIFLQIAALPFIIANLLLLFDSGLLPARRAAIINISVIFVLLSLIIICWKLKMTAFLITGFVIIWVNFVMLVFSMYRLTTLYIEVIKDDKKGKNITTPKGNITEFIKNYF